MRGPLQRLLDRCDRERSRGVGDRMMRLFAAVLEDVTGDVVLDRLRFVEATSLLHERLFDMDGDRGAASAAVDDELRLALRRLGAEQGFTAAEIDDLLGVGGD